MDRQRWTQDRRRKEPSLYDEYLSEERASQSTNDPQSAVTPDLGGTGNTIRAVTPDSIPEEIIVQPKTTRNFERDFLALSSSPPTSSSPRSIRKQRTSPRIGSAKVPSGRSESAVESKRQSTMVRTSQEQGRPRTHSVQSTSAEDNIPEPTRHRKGSRIVSLSQTEASLISSTGGDPPRTTGRKLPSSVSQPAFGTPSVTFSAQQTTTTTPKRPKSSASTSASSAVSGPLPSPNAKRILHLMKTLCGRMSGNVAYRKTSGATWIPTYCFIKEDDGSLMAEIMQQTATLIPDLRGSQIRCLMEEDTQAPYLEVTAPKTSLEIHLRCSTQSDLDSWFAAILCWQPIRPKGLHNRMTKPQAAALSARPLESEHKQNQEVSVLKEAPVIKVGRMVLWNPEISYPSDQPQRSGAGRPTARRMQSSNAKNYGSRLWRRVSCTLRENGELKLFTEAENTLVSVVQLSQLSRSAIQRLDSSVLDSEFCVAIYPQHTYNLDSLSSARPIFLSLESRILYEVWFVLMRAFTIPQLYGPGPKPSASEDDTAQKPDVTRDQVLSVVGSDMFRMERALSVKIIEAKITDESPKTSPELSSPRPDQSPRLDSIGAVYVEVQIDGETRAKTQVKPGPSPFWAQEFEFLDLPAVLSSASVVLKHRPPDGSSSAKSQYESKIVHETYGTASLPQNSTGSTGHTGILYDQTLGKVEIVLEELQARTDIEQRWPVQNTDGNRVGDVLIRARAEENVILMRQEYEPLSQLLHAFENGLTISMALAIPSELRRLSDCLLNIFQVSGRVTDWLMALVEDEIDGLSKETPLSRIRYTQRLGSVEQEHQRDQVVRDMNKNATLEANLLFRGNTLLTKALDSHMRRIGGDYLVQSLGGVIVAINDRDPECEVDPNRVASDYEMRKNWFRLINTTEEVWKSIVANAQKCPTGLRFIFRHIKACAEDRYGDFLRTVSYSSVSGFLFLRFFVPAVLNPRLFGLLKDEPRPRAKRAFTLVAKSLQTMANMANFGTKEPWMEPMNAFLTTHRESFKKFMSDICFVPPPPAILNETPPSYSTPNAIKNRLPMTSKEGFPSLPFLIDDTREFANLVDLWLQASSAGRAASSEEDDKGPLHKFHDACTSLHAHTMECLSKAERAERPTSDLSFRWEELIESLQGSALDTVTPLLDSEVADPGGMVFEDVVTPTAQALKAHADDSIFGFSPGSPRRQAQQRDWEAAPDGGAASATASILSQDRDPRAGFIIPSTSLSSSTNTYRSSTIANLPGSAAPKTQATREASEAARADPTSTESRPAPLQSGHLQFDSDSRPSSAMSGKYSIRSLQSVTEENGEGALPSVSRERARRDRVMREEKERSREAKEKERQRLKGLVGGFGLGKRSKKDKDKEKERE